MAKSFAAVLLGMALLVGCQQQPVAVAPISIPNLDGPTIVPAAPPAVSTPAPQPLPPSKSQPRVAGVPDSWIPYAPANHWRWIVIHHSATPAGNAFTMDRAHRQKGWDELGYHFVIGNGTNSPDGQIEVGPRWPKQKWGAHAKTPDNRYNDYGIGICLVGNFDIERPTPAQLRSLMKLTSYLMKTYHISPDCVLAHGETKPTDCPGHNFHIADIRRRLIPYAQGLDPDEPILASGAASAASATTR